MTRPLAVAQPMMGQPVTRVDGRLKVTGAAPYAADNPVRDLVHAALVCSTVARGTVENVDSAAALRHSGVLRVLTDFAGVTLPYDAGQVHSFGQPVAVVAATTLEAALHGASLVEVRYATQPHVTNVDASDGVHEQASNRNPDYARGGADAALGQAAVVTDLRYSIARDYHNPMELPATVASWDGNRLTVWDKSQHVYSTRQDYAKAFGIPVEQVRVISPFVGGAFGNAYNMWPHQLLTAFAARQLRRPVKLVITRKQTYSGVGFRPTTRQRLAIGADRSGRINTTIHEAHSEISRYDPYEERIAGLPKFLYHSANMRSTCRVVPLDINPPTSMRGPGAVTGAFPLESAMDDLAYRLGMDPIELRLRNEPDRDQAEDLPFSTRRLTECFRQGADTFGWSRRNPTPRATRDGNDLIGIGTAGAAFHALASQCAVTARMNRDGTVDVQTASSDMGPGTYTSMTQVAADALGVPMARVRFALGDSTFPQAPVHGGSQTMASVGSGVFTAANMLRDRFVRTAVVDPGSPLSGLRPEDVAVGDGRMFAVSDPSRGESYRDLLRRRGWESLDSQHEWAPGEDFERYSKWAYGAVFAEVAVDELLGTGRTALRLGKAAHMAHQSLIRADVFGGEPRDRGADVAGGESR